MVCASLTLLFGSQTCCCAFLGLLEFPPTQLIFPLVRWLPRVWVPFLFHSSFTGMLVPSSFLFSLFFSCVLPSFVKSFLPFLEV